MSQQAFYIVVYDDNDSLSIPYSATADGGLDMHSTEDDIAAFPTRKDARKAIRISTAREKYNAAMGKPVNADFTYSISNVKIRRVVLGGGK